MSDTPTTKRFIKTGKMHILIGNNAYMILKKHIYPNTNEFVRYALEKEVYTECTDRLFYHWEDDEWVRGQ
jgi:hypothetical protein